MIEIQLDDARIYLPSDIAFAYNPYFMTFDFRDSGYAKGATVEVEVYDNSYHGNGEMYTTFDVQLYGGYAQMDISPYLHAPFLGKAKYTNIFPTSHEMILVIRERDTQDEAEFAIVVIYGAMARGERFNASRLVTLWKNYPQVVSYFAPAGTKVYLQADDQEPFLNQDYMTYEINNYDNNISPSPMQESGQIVIMPEDGVQSSFAMQYDGSFSGIDDATIINIKVDDREQCDDCIFLRWLDAHGFWQYWLFSLTEVQLADAVVGSALTFLAGGTYPYYVTRNIGKEVVKQVTAVAPNVTKEDWNFLVTIKGSVDVCAFDTATQTWVPVNVTAEKASWKSDNTSAHYQDFVIKVVYPTQQQQRL